MPLIRNKYSTAPSYLLHYRVSFLPYESYHTNGPYHYITILSESTVGPRITQKQSSPPNSMPEVLAVCKNAILGGGRNITLVLLLLITIAFPSCQNAVLVGPVQLGTRAPTQPANHSSGRIYYISSSHLYASFHSTDSRLVPPVWLIYDARS